MSWGIVGAVGSTALKLYSSNQAAKAGKQAAQAQSDAAQAGIDENRRQFDELIKRLEPYTQAGPGALGAQQSLLGLSGPDAQQQAISGIQDSPQFRSLLQQGESSILANASATGGLRGGNVQGALGQFSPALLSQLINDQYSRLGGITNIGQNSAAFVGNAGLQTGNNVSNLLEQQGAALAGGRLAQGKARAAYASDIASGIGQFFGAGGFGGFGG